MSRVFLSYSRADEDFATRLRTRLEQEAPDVSLWQDRVRMEGGVGWWQQIKDALDQVEFMILVTSEATLHSETVQKEWRYARQQGVCVYPVKAAEFDFAALPRWMSSTHFFDIEKEWPTFVQHLRSPAYVQRVPFMAPDVPANFVERAAETTKLQECFLETGRLNAVATTGGAVRRGRFWKNDARDGAVPQRRCHHGILRRHPLGDAGRNPSLQAAVTALTTRSRAAISRSPTFSPPVSRSPSSFRIEFACS